MRQNASPGATVLPLSRRGGALRGNMKTLEEFDAWAKALNWQTMNGLSETCHCGHDKATHYRDQDIQPPEHSTCLAMACACGRYVNDREPKPSAKPGTPVRPAHSLWCQCLRCEAWDDANQEKTEPSKWAELDWLLP
jgi:hypothetical protein